MSDQILEPIASMIELGLLNFSGKDAKLLIKNHGIMIDDPSSYNYTFVPQSATRMFFGAGKEDIYILNNMILNYIDWYLIGNYNDNFNIYKDIALFAVQGLKKLQSRYDKGIVVLAIQYYIIIIVKSVKDMEKYRKDISENNKLEVRSKERLESLTSDYDDSINDYDTILSIDDLEKWTPFKEKILTIVNTDKIKEIWSKEDVYQIHKELSDCFDKYKPKTGQFVDIKIDGLMKILIKKNKDFNDIVKLSYGES